MKWITPYSLAPCRNVEDLHSEIDDKQECTAASTVSILSSDYAA